MSYGENYPSLLCLRGYPPEMRDALADAAAAAHVSANTYAVRVLAEIYDVDVDVRGRRLRAKRSKEFEGETVAGREPGSTLQLQLPPELNYRIHERAMRNRVLLRDLVLGHLATHLGLSYTTPRIQRGRRRKVAA